MSYAHQDYSINDTHSSSNSALKNLFAGALRCVEISQENEITKIMDKIGPAQKSTSSSNINSYRGETKLRVTELEYTWVIRDFAKSSLMNRECITSPRFISLHRNVQYSWTMYLYPKFTSTGYPTVSIAGPYYNDDDYTCTEKIKYFTLIINLLDNDRKIVDLNFVKHTAFYINRPYHTLTQDNLESYLANGNLTLIIKLFFEDDDEICRPIVTESSNTILGRENRLLEFDDFENLLDSGKFSDITLITGYEKFHAHKSILSARSPVFSAMFEHDMKENHENEIEIPDIEPAVMKEILRFIYAGKVQRTDGFDAHLFLAANKYGLTRLKDACEMRLIDNINFDNLCDILKIADLCVPSKLLNAVLEFMRSNSRILKHNEELRKIICKLSSDLITKMFNAVMFEL